jgi:hypothetical protein
VNNSPFASDASVISGKTGRRPPARAVRLLLPVWGNRYVRQFLDFSLPTMLAPGNLPALTGTLPCSFVLLTSSDDARFIADHPGYQFLSSVCSTEIQLIDDLITGDNYSTTITLAYERAVRATGAEMLDTCFFFLISDYLVADGSLRNALARVLAGASGVFAGNFQIIQEDAAPEFYENFEQDGPELTIAPRELMSWALDHLHPMTTGNMVNFTLSHTAHTNRLFWRVDQDTLIGRFYLMHMICIRPEVADFVIGSSCDYSFIPEMCPSGSIEALTDSDEYLVVEMQPRDHERAFLRMGPFDPDALAETLSEWTTARHRENAGWTLVFHAKDLPGRLPAVRAEADRFVALVGARLSSAPQPHRDHPYWLGAIAAHRWSIRRMRRDAGLASQPRTHSGWSLTRVIQELRVLVFGRPPYVHPWHPRWPDYRVLQDRLQKLLSGSPGTLMVAGQNDLFMKGWILRFADEVKLLQTPDLLRLNRRQYLAQLRSFQGCVVLVTENELHLCQDLVERIFPLLTDDGFLLLAVINGRANAMHDGFAANFAYWSSHFQNVQECISSTDFVPVTPARAMMLRWLVKLNGVISNNPFLAPFLALPVGLLMLASYAANKATRESNSDSPGSVGYSSVFITFRPAGWSRLPEFEEEDGGYWARKRGDRQKPKYKVLTGRDV